MSPDGNDLMLLFTVKPLIASYCITLIEYVLCGRNRVDEELPNFDDSKEEERPIPGVLNAVTSQSEGGFVLVKIEDMGMTEIERVSKQIIQVLKELGYEAHQRMVTMNNINCGSIFESTGLNQEDPCKAFKDVVIKQPPQTRKQEKDMAMVRFRWDLRCSCPTISVPPREKCPFHCQAINRHIQEAFDERKT
eukprot:15348350-Ditylum_brightwellii.AAC.1